MKYWFCATVIILGISGCRSYSYIDSYEVNAPLSRLPQLSVITDQEIFYGNQNPDYYNTYSRSLGSASNIHIVERQFTSYILDQLTNAKSEKSGYAVMRINHLKVRNTMSLFSVLAILSVGSTTLLGLPAGRYHVELDMTLEILDKDQNILGTYRGKGRQKAFIGMYYGYGEREAKEKAIYESVEQSLNQINEKVMTDMSYLNTKLKKN
ncbi:hypothetical protein [Portibacter marinus]|uniref:hypothetical protein n=1 Tax=Portibacter marinus TaxID=2898660 RepID=UPI001F34714A|nr:hypothetical protein [Portibacter marinus]